MLVLVALPQSIGAADLSVVKTGPAEPVSTGDWMQYTIVVTNISLEIAVQVRLLDPLPGDVNFESMTVDDASGGSDVTCASMPTHGSNDAPIDCTIATLAPQSTATFTVLTQVKFCTGPDHTAVNTATVSSDSIDPDTSNNASSSSVAVVDYGYCDDGNYCTEYDACYDGICYGQPINGCGDNSVCTLDSCDPQTGCVNDPTPGDQCADANPCTRNACDPIAGCVFPPEPAGVSCPFVGPCAVAGVCDGQGTCTGVSVCNDGNPCTDDVTDVPNGCACSHTPVAAGTACDDGDACTVATTCDGAGACLGAALGQVPGDIGNTLYVVKWGNGFAAVRWVPIANADWYQLLRGTLGGFPVGPGSDDESCVRPQQWGEEGDDLEVPPPGSGFWYLARGVNACAGPGPYGFQAAHGVPTVPRASTTCP